MCRQMTRPSAGGERGALGAVQRSSPARSGVVLGVGHRLRPAGVLDDPPALALGRDDEPREDGARVLDGVGVVDQPQPGGLDDVLAWS